MLNLAILLEDSAREVPERTAIVCEGTRLSYAELNAAASQAAHGLVQAGIQKGDTVALSCQDVPSFVIAYYGILKAGAVVMPLNVLLKPREIAYHLTGDIGRRDEDGYIYIVDRVKDMIIRGGFNVYPREIEEVLMTHPAVSLAAVIGVPHEHGRLQVSTCHRVPYGVAHDGHGQSVEERTALVTERKAAASRWRSKER